MNKPWKIAEHSWSDTSIVDSKGNTVCRSSIAYCDEDEQQELEEAMNANMKLIAKAPEVMDKVQSLVAAHNSGDDIGPLVAQLQEIIEAPVE